MLPVSFICLQDTLCARKHRYTVVLEPLKIIFLVNKLAHTVLLPSHLVAL